MNKENDLHHEIFIGQGRSSFCPQHILSYLGHIQLFLNLLSTFWGRVSYLGQRCSRSLYNPYCEHQECLKVKFEWQTVSNHLFLKSRKFCSICHELKARPFRLVTILMMFNYDLYHIHIMYMIIEQFNCIYSHFLFVEIRVKWTL